MKGFPKDLIDIVRLLENNPLKSYRELAGLAKVSPQTFIRRVKELKSQDIIRNVHSTLRPGSLYLDRFIVIFKVSKLEGITYLELACDVHPYTAQRNRIFGHIYGLYAVFDIPKGSFDLLKDFLDMLKDRGYCTEYETFTSQGIRRFYPQPFHKNITDLDKFDLEGYYAIRMFNTKEEIVENIATSTPDFHPIQLLIMRDITTDMRIQKSELSNKYRNYLQIPEKDENFYSLPKGFRKYIKEFYSTSRTENAIYIDFKKKYNAITKNHVEYYWSGFNRKYFEMFITFAYIIYDISVAEKRGILNLIQKERPPFNIYIEDLGKNLILSLSLPPYYQTKFAYMMKITYDNFSTYQLDPFGYNAVKYRFYVHNYDLEKKKWKRNKKWMFDNVVGGIDEALSNNQFRKVSNKLG